MFLILDNGIILLTTQGTVWLDFFHLFQTGLTEAHMPAGEQYTCAFVCKADRANFVFVIDLEQVLSAVNVIDSER